MMKLIVIVTKRLTNRSCAIDFAKLAAQKISESPFILSETVNEMSVAVIAVRIDKTTPMYLQIF